MRREVSVMLPSVEGRQTFICPSEPEEVAFNISSGVAAEKVITSTAPSFERGAHNAVNGEGLDIVMTKNFTSSFSQQAGATPLQWGSLKRKRSNNVINCRRKSCVLLFEFKAELASILGVVKDSSADSGKGVAHPENDKVSMKDHGFVPLAVKSEHPDIEEGSKREGTFGTFVQTYKRRKRQNHPQTHHSDTQTSLASKLALPADKHAAVLVEAGLPRKDVWPKFVLKLSQKEIKEDLFLFKGSKRLQRPKRMSKAIEKALLSCTPGSWLSDVSYSRYNVREK